jgi:hypothetical protein
MLGLSGATLRLGRYARGWRGSAMPSPPLLEASNKVCIERAVSLLVLMMILEDSIARRKAIIALTRIEYRGRPVGAWTYFQNNTQFSTSQEFPEGAAEFYKTYAFNVSTERNGIVSGERPKKTRRAGNTPASRRRQEKKNQGRHNCSSRVTICSLGKDFNKRESGRGIQGCIDISEAKQERNQKC